MGQPHTQDTVHSYRVETRIEGPKKATVETRGLEIVVDAPEKGGGTNEGPNPVEYVLGSLAGCVNVVGTMVAREMALDLEIHTIVVEGDIDVRRFTGTETDERAGYREIRVTIGIETDADSEAVGEWSRLLEERNPVLDTLRSPTPVHLAVSTD